MNDNDQSEDGNEVKDDENDIDEDDNVLRHEVFVGSLSMVRQRAGRATGHHCKGAPP